MNLPFFKMHGCGNDYIFCDLRASANSTLPKHLSLPELAVCISDRHTGVGGDGLVLIRSSVIADATMQMFNADGSEGSMCGNALRCIGRYLRKSSGGGRERFTVETMAGVRWVRVPADDPEPVTAEMGPADFGTHAVGLPEGTHPMIGQPFKTAYGTWYLTALSVGNPHCVLFDFNRTLPSLSAVAGTLYSCGLFPEGANVSLAEITGEGCLNIRVWERGSGETQSCGTAACAAVAAAVKNGYCRENTEIECRMPGGTLTVRYQSDNIFLTGAAEYVFCGEYSVPD